GHGDRDGGGRRSDRDHGRRLSAGDGDHAPWHAAVHGRRGRRRRGAIDGRHLVGAGGRGPPGPGPPRPGHPPPPPPPRPPRPPPRARTTWSRPAWRTRPRAAPPPSA